MTPNAALPNKSARIAFACGGGHQISDFLEKRNWRILAPAWYNHCTLGQVWRWVLLEHPVLIRTTGTIFNDWVRNLPEKIFYGSLPHCGRPQPSIIICFRYNDQSIGAVERVDIAPSNVSQYRGGKGKGKNGNR